METLLQIVSVTVRANGLIEDVLAFMETGSTTTLIAEDLVDKIGLSGPTKLVSLKCLLLRFNAPSRRDTFEFFSRDGKHVRSVDGV